MGTHPIFESDFDCLTELRNFNHQRRCRDLSSWETPFLQPSKRTTLLRTFQVKESRERLKNWTTRQLSTEKLTLKTERWQRLTKKTLRLPLMAQIKKISLRKMAKKIRSRTRLNLSTTKKLLRRKKPKRRKN